MLRVGALGLEAQLDDGNNFNPGLALPGRFDFAFALVFLTPLVVIALFRDLAPERDAGYARMLVSGRTSVDACGCAAAACSPHCCSRRSACLSRAGAAMSGASIVASMGVLALVAGYLLFCVVLTLLVGRLQ